MSESGKNDFQESAAENKKQLEIFPGARQQEKQPKTNTAPRLDANTADKQCFVPQQLPQQQGINPDTDTKFSIFASINHDGSFDFKIMGTEQSYTNLVGLYDFISARVKQEKDKKLQTGDAITIALFQGIQQLNAKLDALLSNLDRPSNKL